MRGRGAHPGTRLGRVAAVLLVGVLLAVSCGPAGPQDAAIYVDPVLGGDAQPGTAAAPLRTLTANRVGAYVANGSRMLLTDVLIDANGLSTAEVNAGIFVADQGQLALTDSAVNGNVRGIEMRDQAVVGGTGVEFVDNDAGIVVQPYTGSPYLALTDALVENHDVGIWWRAPDGGRLIVRGTQFDEHAEKAARIAGDPDMVDFGSVGSPGGNLFTASTWPQIVDARPARAAPDGTVATFSSVGVAHGCIASFDPYVGPFSLVCGPHPIFTIVNANQRLQLVGN